MAVEIPKTKKAKRHEDNHKISKDCGTTAKRVTCVIGITEEERK